jgi:hypothetical protein
MIKIMIDTPRQKQLITFDGNLVEFEASLYPFINEIESVFQIIIERLRRSAGEDFARYKSHE